MRKILLVILMLSMFLPCRMMFAEEHDSAKHHYLGRSYQVFDYGMSWDEAEAYCEKLGGHLVTIGSTTEQAFVKSLLAKGTRHVYWMGGQRIHSGNWEWITREPFSYTQWANGQPDFHGGKEAKLIMYRIPMTDSSYQSGDWDELQPSGEYEGHLFFGLGHTGFICEWES